MSVFDIISFHSEQQRILFGTQKTISPKGAKIAFEKITNNKYSKNELKLIEAALLNSGYSTNQHTGELDLDIKSQQKISNQNCNILTSTTTDFIPDHEIEKLMGVVSGSVAYSKHFMSDVFAGIQASIGGEVTEYTELVSEARLEAMNRMQVQAKDQGADAVINVRYGTSSIAEGISEILAYGTAVKLKRIIKTSS
ncbi:YbjQ family protein [Photobacterium frigidiphilum]|uniref:YbjQ family protein n=1 Tax=Photobacterium frigidiphilum TaxID=264736 RepID=UPI003D14CD2A